MELNIGIKPEFLAKVAHSLSKIMADEFVLYTKTLRAHWCVTGPDFHSKHLYFEGLYEDMADICDDIAERIRTIGHFPPASLREFLDLTHLSEDALPENNGIAHIKALLQDHESIIIHYREHINGYADALHDLGSSDYITGLMEKHEKIAWMLRSHLE
ncbi:MAG: DNA starvation/stationary phase protection protein [Mucilaginibacter sp.]|nr:DNA starvation/stationary phase protection protein [Mucilaginibacter sp.]